VAEESWGGEGEVVSRGIGLGGMAVGYAGSFVSGGRSEGAVFVIECRWRDIDTEIDIDRTYIQTERKLSLPSITAKRDVLCSEFACTMYFPAWYPCTSPSLTPSLPRMRSTCLNPRISITFQVPETFITRNLQHKLSRINTASNNGHADPEPPLSHSRQQQHCRARRQRLPHRSHRTQRCPRE